MSRKGKWQPFNALETFSEVIKKTAEKSERQEKPVLDEQKIEEIIYLLTESLAEKKNITVLYFDNARIVRYLGFVEKINMEQKSINISGRILDLGNIIDCF